MLNTIRAIVREGRIELLEDIEIPEGTEVLVTPLMETEFWSSASETALNSIWDNSEDDVYATLLEE
ncbi:MAG: hypothetical protein QOH63_164 [Acidobacteriota bacterium]|jgi:hypothetical protein|nr:hypothetical protein [Acidobacteriota bacterium]